MAEAATLAERQLVAAAEYASKVRWELAADMNSDRLVTVSDVGLWLKWIFYAPGDLLLLATMKHMPGTALFMEWSPGSLYGGWSFFISVIAWLWALGALMALVNEVK